jgi:hypothetical protein
VKLALAPNISYSTDDPDTMPFVAFAIPQASYMLGGGHYVRGGGIDRQTQQHHPGDWWHGAHRAQ